LHCGYVGKGTYRTKNSGTRYDGEWEKGERSGFGIFSKVNSSGLTVKLYTGNWKHNMKHVSAMYSKTDPNYS